VRGLVLALVRGLVLALVLVPARVRHKPPKAVKLPISPQTKH